MSQVKAQSADIIAADYYDSADADRFYALVWGGEDIHIGLYDSPDEPIAVASDRTVAALLDLATDLPIGGALLILVPVMAVLHGDSPVSARVMSMP